MTASFRVLIICLCSLLSGCASWEVALFSWQPRRQPWHFALIPESDLPKGAAKVYQSPDASANPKAFKVRLSRVRKGRSIAWRDYPNSPVTYPPPAIMADIIRFAEQRGIGLYQLPTLLCP